MAGAVGILGTLRILVDADTLKAQKALQAFGGKAQMAGAAIGAALGGAAIAGLKMGDAYDKVIDDIRTITGATGAELLDLEESFKRVGGAVSADIGLTGEVMANLNTRTGATGARLEDLTKTVIRLASLTGADAVNSVGLLTRMFGDWSIATEDQQAALDKVFRTFQTTGVGIEQLAEQVVQFGAPLRNIGFTFEESIAMLGKWEKEGVNTVLALGGMKQALGKFAKEGVDVKTGMWDLVDSIKNAESPMEAMALGAQMFGKRAGPDMVAAIREGRFEFMDYVDTIENGENTIAATAAANADLGSSFKKLMNTVRLKVGDAFEDFAGITDAMGSFVYLIPMLAAGMGKMVGKALTSGPVKAAVSMAGAAMGQVWGLAMTGMRGLGGVITQGWGKVGALAGGRFGMAFKFAAAIAIAALWLEVWNQFQKFQQTVEASQKDLQEKVASIHEQTADEVLTNWQNTSDKLASLGGFDRALADTWAGKESLDALHEFGKTLLSDTTLTAQQIGQGVELMSASAVHAAARGNTDMEKEFRSWANLLRMYEPIDAAQEGGKGLGDALAQVATTASALVEKAAYLIASADLAGPIKGAFKVATDAVAKGFGSIKDALANPPQMISKADRLDNMDKRLSKVMKNLHKAIEVGDPWAIQYWERARAKQQLAMEKLKGTNVARLKDVRRAYRQAGGEVEGRWKDVRIATIRETGTATDAVVADVEDMDSDLDAIDTFDTGFGLGTGIEDGIRASIPGVRAASIDLANAAGENLEPGSPPKKGPLHDMDRWGKPLIDVWLKGIEGQVGRVSSVGARLADALAPHPRLGALALAGGAAGSRMGGNTYNVGVLVADDSGIDALERRMTKRRRLRSRGANHYNDPD